MSLQGARAKRRRFAICAKWCRPLCEVSAAAAESQGVSISFEPGEEIEAPIERARMERVFLNLIGNALEAMPGGGAIHITERVDRESVLIRITDTGRAFCRPFARSCSSLSSVRAKKMVLGLGLALSRQTVLDHGGEIWVEEGSPGARFVVRLPAAKRGSTARPLQPAL